MRLSGLQREVLSLYRSLLRAGGRKGKETQNAVKLRFREDSKRLDYKDIKRIEHFVRYGKKQRTLLESPAFNALSLQPLTHNTSNGGS